MAKKTVKMDGELITVRVLTPQEATDTAPPAHMMSILGLKLLKEHCKKIPKNIIVKELDELYNLLIRDDGALYPENTSFVPHVGNSISMTLPEFLDVKTAYKTTTFNEDNTMVTWHCIFTSSNKVNIQLATAGDDGLVQIDEAFVDGNKIAGYTIGKALMMLTLISKPTGQMFYGDDTLFTCTNTRIRNTTVLETGTMISGDISNMFSELELTNTETGETRWYNIFEDFKIKDGDVIMDPIIIHPNGVHVNGVKVFNKGIYGYIMSGMSYEQLREELLTPSEELNPFLAFLRDILSLMDINAGTYVVK